MKRARNETGAVGVSDVSERLHGVVSCRFFLLTSGIDRILPYYFWYLKSILLEYLTYFTHLNCIALPLISAFRKCTICMDKTKTWNWPHIATCIRSIFTKLRTDSNCSKDSSCRRYRGKKSYTEYAGLGITAKSVVGLRLWKPEMLVPNCTGAYGNKVVSRPSLVDRTS